MIITPSWIGIDVSKHNLDVFDEASNRHRRIANTRQAIVALMTELAGPERRVIFEATGHYDRTLRRVLGEAGIPFSRVNPVRARAFAKAAGYLAKTDKVDARMLTAYGRAVALRQEPPADPGRERLTALTKRRDQLVAMRQQERTRLKELADEGLELELDLGQHIAFLDAAIGKIEAAIETLVQSLTEIADARRLMQSVPGIGVVTANILAALMPELGTRSPKAIAALAGLAPLNADSGLHRGQRRIREGRRRVRRALYMAAVAAARGASRFGVHYRALRSAGKPAKVALIAVARKLLVTLNAILKTKTPFHA